MAQTSLNSTGVASSGALSLQSNGTTEAIGISTGQVATLAQNPILTSGTVNGVAYLNGSKVLTTGSALTFDGTNLATTGFINTAAGYTVGGLKIGGNLVVASQSTSLWVGDILNNFAGGTAFFATGSEQMRLTSTGLGIGGSSPAYKLQVTTSATGAVSRWNYTGGSRGARIEFGLNETGSGAENYIDFSGTSGTSAGVFRASGGEVMRISSDGTFRVKGAGTAGSTDAFQVAGAAPASALLLNSSGNVGIGESSPVYKLDVLGSVRLKTGATGTPVIVSTGSDSQGTVRFGSGSSEYSINGGADYLGLIFNTNGSERARIDSSGNLLVGTTSAGRTNSDSITLEPKVSGGGYAVFNHATGSSSGRQFISFALGGTEIGSITQLGTTGVLYNTTSDYRLKTVIGPVANAGQRIDALQPVEYTWKADGSRTRGFLAHQFQEVYAGSVSGTKDAVDAKGKPVYQSMQASSSEVIADLVAEIQSLRKRLAAAGI